MEVSKTPKKKEDTTMKRKKFLALALAGVMTAVTLTACAPLDALYDWFFGGGSSNASHGSEKGLVTESVELENQLRTYFNLSETTASARAKETLEEVAKKFDAEWLIDGELVNKPAIDDALGSIMKDKLLNQQLCVDVMEWPFSDGTAVTDPGHRMIYVGGYKDRGPDTGGPSYYAQLTKYSFLKGQLNKLHINNAELYAGTFQKGDKTYAAMVIIF